MKDEEVIEEDFDLCEDFDYYTKTVKRKDGKIEVIFKIDAKTEKGEKILEENPKLIKEAILRCILKLKNIGDKMKREIPRLDKSDIEDYNIAKQSRIRLMLCVNKMCVSNEMAEKDDRLIKHGIITKNKSLTEKGKELWDFIIAEESHSTKEDSVLLEEKERMIVKYLLKKYKTVSLQAEEFKEMTGKSIATFYRVKRGIKECKRREWANNSYCRY